MGAMTPPSRKSCYNFRVIEINRVLDGDTIDVTIDLGFDLFKKEELESGVDIPEKRIRNLEEKALGIDATNWPKKSWKGENWVMMTLLFILNLLVGLAKISLLGLGLHWDR